MKYHPANLDLSFDFHPLPVDQKGCIRPKSTCWANAETLSWRLSGRNIAFGALVRYVGCLGFKVSRLSTSVDGFEG